MIAYYVSGHGYGHAVRTCDILRALQENHPNVPVHLTSQVPEEFFRNRLPSAPIHWRWGQFDVGMVQLDSVRVDVNATCDRVSELYGRETELVDQEAAWLSEMEARLVVSDVAAIPMSAARAVGTPCIAVGNFAWNWIYAPFVHQDARWQHVIERLEAGYRCADLLLRLPFAEPMSVFHPQQHVPLLARPGRPDRARLAELTGADPSRTWVLLSFSTLELTDTALDRLASAADISWFTVLPLQWNRNNLYAIDREQMSFADVLTTVDVVLTKPGYGVVSECIVNDKAIVYVDREDFVEYPILESAIRAHLQHVHIPADDLYAGHVTPYVQAALASPAAPEPMPGDGDVLVADILYATWKKGITPPVSCDPRVV